MEQALARLAEAQHGVFSRRQAHEAGYTDRQIEIAVARGDWVRCASSVLRVAGAPSSFLGAACVALQAAGDGAMLSHRVAGQLHRLDGVPPSVLFDLYIPQARRPRDVPRARLHRVDVGAPTYIMGLPVSPVALTVVDLARELPADTGMRIVADAIRTGRVSLPALEAELTRATLRRQLRALARPCFARTLDSSPCSKTSFLQSSARSTSRSFRSTKCSTTGGSWRESTSRSQSYDLPSKPMATTRTLGVRGSSGTGSDLHSSSWPTGAFSRLPQRRFGSSHGGCSTWSVVAHSSVDARSALSR
jgi:hypothetical protein